jgi:hypothetical protein
VKQGIWLIWKKLCRYGEESQSPLIGIPPASGTFPVFREPPVESIENWPIINDQVCAEMGSLSSVLGANSLFLRLLNFDASTLANARRKEKNFLPLRMLATITSNTDATGKNLSS